MDKREVDVLGLLARERVLPDTKRTAWFIPLNRDGNALVSARAVLKAAAAAWKPKRAVGGGGSDSVVHELEAMPEEGGPS